MICKEKGMSFFKMLENIDINHSDSYKPQGKVGVFVMHFGEGWNCFDVVKQQGDIQAFTRLEGRMSRPVIYYYTTTSQAHKVCL
jgi:hypothetical protein